MKFIDIFSGIGGFRSGLEKAGHECIGHIEIDKYANKSYEAIYGGDDLIGTDIRAITDRRLREFRGECDLVVGGFPCQAFSIAGHKGGFQDTRGTLFFELARVVEQVQPQVLVFENVKNLLSHDKGQTFEVILKTLDELRYDVSWQVLNSKDFGVAQNRERVYIVGFLRGGSRREVFPIRGSNKEDNSNLKISRIGTLGPYNSKSIVDCNGLSPTLCARDYKDPIKIRQIGKSKVDNPQRYRVYDIHGLSPTLTTVGGGGLKPVVKINSEYRNLTPLEYWRLQGFTDEQFYKAKNAGISDSQLYKQAGNAVTVNVIYEIGKRLKGE